MRPHRSFTSLALITLASITAVALAGWPSAAPTTLPTTTPTASADGVPYGPPSDVQGKPPKLPYLGESMGFPAADFVGRRQVWSAGAETEVDRLFRFFPADAARERRYQFYLKASVGDVVGFDLDRGRIHRLGVFWAIATSARVQSIRDRLRAFNGITVEMENVARDCYVLRISTNEKAWYLATHPDLSPDCRQAIRDRKLIVGMTEEAAMAAMDGYDRHDEQTDGTGKVVSWSREHIIWGSSHIGQQLGSTSRTAWRCTIVDGKLVSVESYE